MRRIFQNGSIVLPDGVLPEGAVLVEGHHIQDIRSTPFSASEADEVIDLDGRFLAPGFIDIHIHGSMGIDLMVADESELIALSRHLAHRGITGYLPTLVPTDDRGFLKTIDMVSHLIREPIDDGARILGLHFEGPFVNPDRAGALPARYFRTFTSDEDAAPFLAPSLAERIPVRMMTLAPEIEGGLALIEALMARQYVVAIGHSQASFEMCERAAALGARHVTHFPNALAPLHHRHVGVFGWTLLRSDTTLDLIADGVHVDWRMIELIRQVKATTRMALISDAIMAAGLGDGEYEVWGETIRVRHGRTQNERGRLAGSVINLDEAVRHLLRQGVSLTEALLMASWVPARILRIERWTGSIEKGKRADFVCLDEEGRISFTCIDGRVVGVADRWAPNAPPIEGERE